MSFFELRKFGLVEDIIAKLLEFKARVLSSNTARFILNPIIPLSDTLTITDQALTVVTIPRYSDVTNYGNNGTVSGAVYTTGKFNRDGRAGKALSFDGVDDKVTVTDANSLDFGAVTDFLLSVFIKTSAVVAQSIIFKGDNAAGNKYYFIRMDADGKVTAGLSDGTNSRTATSAGTVNNNVWRHILAVFDRDGNLQIYIDGVASGSATAISAVADINNANSLLIGARKNGVPEDQFFNGLIDEPSIFARALSANEITLLSKGGLISKDLALLLFFDDNANDNSGGITGLEEVNA